MDEEHDESNPDDEPIRKPRRRRKDEDDDEREQPKQGLSALAWLGIGFGIFAILVVGCCGGGACLFYRGVQNVAEEVKKQKEIEEERAKSEKAIEVEIDTLESDYKANPAAADNKYKGKRVRVSFEGKIIQVGGKTYWQHPKRFVASGLTFSTSVYFLNKDALSKLQPDTTYTIEGKCTGVSQFAFDDINIVDAVLTSSP